MKTGVIFKLKNKKSVFVEMPIEEAEDFKTSKNYRCFFKGSDGVNYDFVKKDVKKIKVVK